jgi:hypothetical protein
MKVVFGNTWRLPLPLLPAHTPKSITGRLLPYILLLLSLPTLAFIVLETHLNPLLLNPFLVIDIFHCQPSLESLQEICHFRVPVPELSLKLFLMVLFADN